MLNGPIIKKLGFNYTQGVMRDGFMPNTSVGRFWRLYLRNVAGFLPHKNDKATFGNTWRVVVAENEDVAKELGWEPLSVDMGFAAGRRHGDDLAIHRRQSLSSDLRQHARRDAAVPRGRGRAPVFWQIMFTVGQGMGTLRPLILVGPIIARTIAGWGWSKQKLKQYLFDHARIPAREYERILRDWTAKPTWNLEEEYRLGRIPRVFFESDDPNRMVPLVWEPDDYMIVGDRRSGAQQRVRVRAQRRAGLSGHEEDRLGARAGRPAGSEERRACHCAVDATSGTLS